MLRVAGLVGLAAALAWLIAPTSASGPDGMPRGFESGLRYLAPALVLGLALLPGRPAAATATRSRCGESLGRADTQSAAPIGAALGRPGGSRATGLAHALSSSRSSRSATRSSATTCEHRYADPSFTTPGLNAAFKWAQGITDARIATTSTRQYPLYGRDLSNEVDYIGVEQPHGGFTAPTTCRQWRRLLNAATTTT